MPQYFTYAGFWVRFAAALIDSFLFTIMFIPFALVFGPDDYFTNDTLGLTAFDGLQQLISAIVYIGFWMQLSATPGKLLLNLKIVDAETGSPIKLSQAIIRYLGYFISAIVFCLGYFWILFDAKKQAWHDKMARTVVVRVHDE